MNRKKTVVLVVMLVAASAFSIWYPFLNSPTPKSQFVVESWTWTNGNGGEMIVILKSISCDFTVSSAELSFKSGNILYYTGFYSFGPDTLCAGDTLTLAFTMFTFQNHTLVFPSSSIDDASLKLLISSN